MLLIDTDIASAFAKALYFDDLKKLFNNKIAISKAVFDEISVCLALGYKFPNEIINKVPTISLKENEFHTYKKLASKYILFGEGELESIAIAKHRNWMFASFDKKALKCSEKEKVKTIFPLELFQLFMEKTDKNKILEIITSIEEKDKSDLTKLKIKLDLMKL